jgi:hypothetical protein
MTDKTRILLQSFQHEFIRLLLAADISRDLTHDGGNSIGFVTSSFRVLTRTTSMNVIETIMNMSHMIA